MLGRLKVTGLWCAALAVGAGAGWWRFEEPTILGFLAVGQGDCAVFRHRGLTVLIDAGPGTPEFDVGRRVIWPKLRALGVTRIDLALLSHPDADHVAGLTSLRRQIPVRKIAAMSHFREHGELRFWLAHWRVPEGDVLWLEPGVAFELGAYRLTVDALSLEPGAEDNAGSMFVRIEGEGASALFTGDAGEETELAMLRRRDWRAEVLKAGHHGSKTATSAAWLKAVRPRAVVISCGRVNAYGHPAQATLDRIRESGAATCRTDRDGDVLFQARRGDFVRVR